jgi:hypothetical protein
MAAKSLFRADSVIAERQPKTDRLVLDKLLRDMAADKRLDEKALRSAHEILNDSTLRSERGVI